MKMTILTLIITLFTLTLKAPSDEAIRIVKTEPIQPFKQLIYAIGSVECSFDTLAYNPQEEATGYFQIRPIRINDYNKRTGSDYTLNDMFDYYKAEKVFLYYASQIGPYDIERVAKSWNGSGPKVIEYWKLIKQNL